jgi:TPR repeat protein
METGMRKFLIAAALAALATASQATPFQDGATAWKRGDYRNAMNNWRGLTNDATVQNNFGIMYMDGKGVPRNYGTALQWFSRSAANGNSLGQNNLGGMYRDGKGVQRDYVKALTFFKAAAAQGNAAAQVNLGLMLINAQGTQVDPIHAYMWFDLAAQQGVPQAVSYRTQVRSRMSASDVAMATTASQRCRANNFKNCAA